VNRAERRRQQKLSKKTSGKKSLHLSQNSAEHDKAKEALLRGISFHQSGQLDQAIQWYKKSLESNPENSIALSNIGLALTNLGKLDEAVTNLKKAISIKPSSAESYNNLGIALNEQGKFAEALNIYQKAISLKPDYAQAHNNLGIVFENQGKPNEAIICYQKAISIKPDYAQAYSNFGNALKDQGKFDEALDSYQKAITIKPDYAQAYYNFGNTIIKNGNLEDAILSYQKAIKIKPDYAEAHTNLGNALQDQWKLEEAISSHKKAIAIKPDYAVAHSNLILCMQYGKFSQHTLYEESLLWDQIHSKHNKTHNTPYINSPDPHRLLRIGIVSADLRRHSIAYFFEPFISHHDKSHFVFVCYSNSISDDDVTYRLKSHSIDWRTIVRMSDEEVEKQIIQDKIDILIDLSGHSGGNRLSLFTRKPAPIQINWMGHANTTGVSTMDYRITDHIADPPGVDNEPHSENLMRLPKGLYCYRFPEATPPISDLPSATGKGVVFGSFNNIVKLNVPVIKLWATLLKGVPNSRLLLKHQSFSCKTTRDQFLSIFDSFGVSSSQVEYLPRTTTLEGHLQLYNQIDIGLDPFPFNGATTTCEAMLMGVPVIVLRGQRHAARVGASLLSQIGMESLIAENESQYIEIATALANDRKYLSELRKLLREKMIASPLCDHKGFTNSMENLLRGAWVAWCANQNAA
jgi:protein O-GlcNAc transferase